MDREEIQNLDDARPSHVPQLVKNYRNSAFLFDDKCILLKIFQLKSKKLLLTVKRNDEIFIFLEPLNYQPIMLNRERCIMKLKHEIISFDFDDETSLFAIFRADFKVRNEQK